MKTDRELLELAAKAIGGVHQDMAKRVGYELLMHETAHKPFWMFDGKHSHHWTPLTDDGDALRLAVKLEFGVAVFDSWVESTDGTNPSSLQYVTTTMDIYAATRRAIVSAAAAIGETM